MLFTKLIIMIFIFCLSINSNNLRLKNKYNVNDINKFCDNCMRIICFSIIQLININMMFQFSTNDDIQLIIQLNIFFLKLWINLIWFIIEKTFATFMFNNVTILFISIFHIICICSIFQNDFRQFIQLSFHLCSE